MEGVTIYHNRARGTSRAALAMIQEAGMEPRVVEHLKAPPDEAGLRNLLARTGLAPPGLLRRKSALWPELGLDAKGVSEETILAAMLAHPVLMERPAARVRTLLEQIPPRRVKARARTRD